MSRTLRCATIPIALVLGACSPGPAGDDGGAGAGVEPIGRTASAIIGSTPSDAGQNAVVMLVYSDPANNRRGICTAALVAPRLVLTARHCVADTDTDVSCNADGAPDSGGGVIGNHPPGTLYVFTGTERPDLDPKPWKPAGRGIEVLDDGSKNLCNHDLALVLLEQPVAATPLAALRLDGDAERGERLLTVGWGVTSTVDEPATRQQRSGVLVTRVGPDESEPVLTPNEFGFDESICLGDSGGPVFSERSGAIVGVVSRGGNGTSSNKDFVSTCTMATNLGTKLSPFRDLITRGFDRAGATPKIEEPRADESSGCSAAPGGQGDGAFRAISALLVLGLVLAKRRLRRPRSPASRRLVHRAAAHARSSTCPSTHDRTHCSAGSPLRNEIPPRWRSTASGFASTSRR
jgi:hypothetical protein